MTKNQLLKVLDKSQADVARMLGYTRGAVSQWEDDKPIPQSSYLRLRYELAPDADWPDKQAKKRSAKAK